MSAHGFEILAKVAHRSLHSLPVVGCVRGGHVTGHSRYFEGAAATVAIVFRGFDLLVTPTRIQDPGCIPNFLGWEVLPPDDVYSVSPIKIRKPGGVLCFLAPG